MGAEGGPLGNLLLSPRQCTPFPGALILFPGENWLSIEHDSPLFTGADLCQPSKENSILGARAGAGLSSLWPEDV